jgi:hypothetical protein
LTDGGREPEEISRWTLVDLRCFCEAKNPSAAAQLDSFGAFEREMARIDAEEREWFEPAKRR